MKACWLMIVMFLLAGELLAQAKQCGVGRSSCIPSAREVRELKQRWHRGGMKGRLLKALESGKRLTGETLSEFSLPTLPDSCGETAGSPDLRGLDLRGEGEFLDLSNAILREADLRWARFVRVDLSDALLYGANLQHASFSDVNLNGADFKCAVLDDASFHRTKGRGVTFDSTIARKVTFEADTRFSWSSFKEITWISANIVGARIDDGSSLIGASLEGADISASAFVDADFSRASLKNAKVRETSFVASKFDEAELTDFTAVNSCFYRVSFARAMFEEPASLGSSSVFGLGLNEVRPSQLGLRYVRWNATLEGDSGCVASEENIVGIGLDRIADGNASSIDEVRNTVRVLADLREYYGSDEGFNGAEAREFGFLLAERRRFLYWQTRDLLPWSYLTIRFLLHKHYTEPSLILVSFIVLVMFFAAACFCLLNWRALLTIGGNWKTFWLQPAALTSGHILGFGTCLRMSLKWFFGFAGNLVDVREPLETLGWTAPELVQQKLRWVLVIEAFTGFVWLLAASAVAFDQLLLP